MENTHPLNTILSDIVVYYDPKILKLEYKDKIDIESANTKQVQEYFRMLTCIKYFLQKLLKYKLYFEKFYPETKKISNHEALEHHVYAYLEDMDILRNKLRVFLGVLKNDLKKIASNKEEIDEAMKQFITKVENTFAELKKNRHPHHHRGLRMLDSNIVDAASFSMIVSEDFPLKDRINHDFVKSKYDESMKKAKDNWIKLAKDNEGQLLGLVGVVFEKNAEHIRMVLNIKSVKDVLNI